MREGPVPSRTLPRGPAALAAAGLLLLGACARPPRAALDPAATLRSLRGPAPVIPGGDLATALTALAWKDHPDLGVARGDLAVAEAGIRTAEARPNPAFGFGATKAEGVPQPWTLTYGLTLPVELGGKRRLRIRQAELRVQEAQLAVADTAWRLRSEVRANLVGWQQARASAGIADRAADLWSRLRDLQDQRFRLGQIGAPERAATALEAQRAEAARLAARSALQRATSALALAAGLPPGALQARLDAEPAPDLAPPPGAPLPDTAALVHRLDVRRILLAWDQNETALRQELARRIPDLQLGPGYALDQGVKKWTLGFAVELPLLDRRQGPIAEAVARRKTLEAQLRQAEARDLAEADQAETRLASAIQALAAQREALAETEARLAAVRRNLALGGADRSDLAAAELEALQARGLALEAWAEAQRARLAVEDAFQKPLDPREQPYPFESLRGARP